MTRVLVVSNTAWNMRHYRMGFLRHLMAEGYEVHVACGADDALRAELANIGAAFHPLPAGGVNRGPVAALTFVLRMLWLLARIRPDVLHLFTLGPALIGAAIARIIPVPRRVIVSLTGLGEWRRRWQSGFGRRLSVLARFAWGAPATQVVVQNHDDAELLARSGLIPKARLHVVLGSGVDMPATTPLEDRPVILMVSRMLWSKGVREVVAAAAANPEAEFRLIGGAAEDYASRNPDFVPAGWLHSAALRQDNLCWLGFQTPQEVAAQMRAARAVILPSTYAEGIPRTLIEALSHARPVITCDTPGCKEVVPPGAQSGILIPAGDQSALNAACRDLINDKEKAVVMGRAGRRLAATRFAAPAINAELSRLYSEGAHSDPIELPGR